MATSSLPAASAKQPHARVTTFPRASFRIGNDRAFPLNDGITGLPPEAVNSSESAQSFQ
jgi:hypothetical protein